MHLFITKKLFWIALNCLYILWKPLLPQYWNLLLSVMSPDWFWSRYLGALSPLSLWPGFTQELFQIYLTGLEIWSLLDTLIGYLNSLFRTTLNFFLWVFSMLLKRSYILQQNQIDIIMLFNFSSFSLYSKKSSTRGKVRSIELLRLLFAKFINLNFLPFTKEHIPPCWTF